MIRPTATLFALAATASAQIAAALAQNVPTPRCDFSGSANVTVNGLPKLRLGDVAGCPNIKYEIIPGLMINGQPAVRIVSDEDCVAEGSADVLADGKPVNRQGDVTCAR